MFSVIGLVLVEMVSTANADLLTAGSRSGTVTVTATGYNTGPGPEPTTTQTLSIPSAGAGNTSAAVYANPFFVGTGTPPTEPYASFGTATASVNLGSVAGNSYSLSASAGFGYISGTSSDAVYVSPAYAFDQQIVISQPVQYTLQMAVARPTFQHPGDLGGNALPIPTETFTGPGVSLSVSAPYYTGIQVPPGSGNYQQAPLSALQTFTGTLAPGTYSFDSSWTGSLVGYDDNYSINDNQAATVSASLSVTSAVPEPASISSLVMFAVALFGLGRKPRNAERTHNL